MTQTPIVLEILPPQPSRVRQDQLLSIFWVAAIGLLLYEIYFVNPPALMSKMATLMITIAALLPSYLWCSGQALGLPVYPMFALSFIWTYALPFVSDHPRVQSYSPQAHLFAGATVTGTIVLGTLVWYRFVSQVPKEPPYFRALTERKGDQFFLTALSFAVLFNITNAAGWIGFLGPFYSIVRNSILGLTAISTFVMCYRLGTRSLSKRQAGVLITLLVTFMITNSLSFLLIGTASVGMIAISSYTIGRKRVPLVLICILFTVVSFLNYGKADMRGKYWFSEIQPTVAPWEYVNLYAEWTDFSWKYLQKREAQETEEDRSFTERASVAQMLLLAQKRSPEELPFLNGETYAIIPQVMVPRIFNQNRIRSQEGTHMLSVHYGLQTKEQTLITSISWGLLAEAYGNFGVWGCAGLAIALGAFYGKVTSLSINAPLLSLRSLYTVLLMTYAFQAEWTAGTYIAAFLQASYLLLGIAFVFMENYRVPRTAFLSYFYDSESN
jgi:hypothetical protein